jgi:hypothetical protein
MNPIHTRLAEQLNQATRTGDMAGAYGVIRGLSAEDANAVALVAGYAVIGIANKTEFFTHLQGQIAQAARLRTDGRGLYYHQKEPPK